MDFKLIEITNFRNYSHEELDLEDSRVWILRGRNSAGKSTLACDALTYALFGKIKAMDEPADLRVKKDDIIKRGKKQARVKIKFTHNGERYSLTRIRKKTKGGSSETVTLYQGENKILGDEKMTSANKWIEEKLWTYNDFINTTLILQDDMTKSLQMARGERKDYLERLFNIKNFEVMSERAREKSKALNRRIDVITEGIRVDNESLDSEEQLRQIQEQLTQALKVKEEQLKEVSNEIDRLESNKKKLEVLQNEYTIHLQKKDERETGIVKQDIAINKLKEETIATNVLIKSKGEIEETNKKLEEIEDKLKQFSTMKKELGELGKEKNKWEKVIQKSLQQILDQKSQVIEQINEIEVQLKRITKEQSELLSSQQNMKILEQNVTRLPKVELEFENSKQNKKRMEEYSKLYTQKKSELDHKLETLRKEIEANEKSVLELQSVEELLKQKQESSEDLIKSEKEKGVIIEEMNKLDNLINGAQSQIEVNNTKIAYETEKIEELSEEIISVSELKGNCPRCKQELSEQHTKTIIDQIENEKVECQERISNYKVRCDKLKNELTEMLQKRSKLVEREVKFVGIISDLRRAADGIGGTKKELASLKKVREKLENFNNEGGYDTQFPVLREELGDLTQKVKTHQVIPEIHSTLEEDYIQLQKDRTELVQKQKVVEKLPEVDDLIQSLSKKST
ncbi:MAG: AAA family ATPase, partial [Candidatus Kariarchaeaceae archaeon]